MGKLKISKPGQIAIINGRWYRAKKAKNGCHGCDLNGPWCPNIFIANRANFEKKIDCVENLLIFKHDG